MRFSSMEAHPQSGLSLYPFRPYSPALQRFTQADPIGLAGGFNLHRFVHNDPVNLIDPFGLRVYPPGYVGPLLPEDRIATGVFDFGYGMQLLRDAYGMDYAEQALRRYRDWVDQNRANAPEFIRFATDLFEQTGGIGLGVPMGNVRCLVAAKTATDSAFQRMLKAGEVIDKGDLTKAGRALQKHGSRPGSVFPSATGNPTAINQQGQRVLQDILSSQNQTIKPNRFGGRDIFDANTGRGVRYDASGNMMGFLEP